MYWSACFLCGHMVYYSYYSPGPPSSMTFSPVSRWSHFYSRALYSLPFSYFPVQQLTGSSYSLSVTEMRTVTFSSSLAVCEIWISSALFIIGSYFMTCRVVFRRRRAWGTVMELHRAVNIGCCPAPSAVGEEGRNRPKYCWTMLPSSWFK